MKSKDGLMVLLLPIPGKDRADAKDAYLFRRRDSIPGDLVSSWINGSDLVLPANVLRRRKIVVDVFSERSGSRIAVFPCGSGPLPSGQGLVHLVMLAQAPVQLRSLIIPEYNIDQSQVPLFTSGGPFQDWLAQATAPWLVLAQWDGRITSAVQGCYVEAGNVRRLSGYWRRRSASI
jgi:hypothetical protein